MNYSHNELRSKIDATLDTMIEKFYRDVPGGMYQRDSENINLDYFKRHTIETILRIRHKRMIDSLVIHHFTKHNPKQAKAWAHYLEDEMLHGQLFAKDLERLFNITLEEIYTYEPFIATKLLNGYFYFTLEHEGPMAALTSAYFLEYTTRMTQPRWLDNLEKILGKENLRGARAHVNHDIKENHSTFVWNVLTSTLKTEEDETKLFRHLETIYGLFCAYFHELYHTVLQKSDIKNVGTIPVTVIEHVYT